MLNIIRAGVILLFIGGLIVSCEDTESTPENTHALTGVYTLTEMTINVEATTVQSTTLAFVSSQDGVDSVTIDAGSVILVESELYTDDDADPIGGTVTLEDDLSGNLQGFLPVNWGTGCAPSILISALGSDGVWSADTTTGVFTLDLVVDQLDIDGLFALDGQQLEVTYVATMPGDERIISSVTYMGAEVAVNPVCVPVSTVTERILKLTRN